MNKFYCVIEGPDGSGKTEVVRALSEVIPKATVMREPGGSPFGEALRELLLLDRRARDLQPYAQALAFAAGSFSAASALASAPFVLGDRWAPISSRVYQVLTAARSNLPGSRAMLEKFWDQHVAGCRALGTVLVPHAIIYLSTSASVAHYRRQKSRVAPDNTDDQVPESTEQRVRLYDDMLLTKGMYGIPRAVIRTDSLKVDDVVAHALDAITSFLSPELQEEFLGSIRRVEL